MGQLGGSKTSIRTPHPDPASCYRQTLTSVGMRYGAGVRTYLLRQNDLMSGSGFEPVMTDPMVRVLPLAVQRPINTGEGRAGRRCETWAQSFNTGLTKLQESGLIEQLLDANDPHVYYRHGSAIEYFAITPAGRVVYSAITMGLLFAQSRGRAPRCEALAPTQWHCLRTLWQGGQTRPDLKKTLNILENTTRFNVLFQGLLDAGLIRTGIQERYHLSPAGTVLLIGYLIGYADRTGQLAQIPAAAPKAALAASQPAS